jgi:hypothetical protein
MAGFLIFGLSFSREIAQKRATTITRYVQCGSA